MGWAVLDPEEIPGLMLLDPGVGNTVVVSLMVGVEDNTVVADAVVVPPELPSPVHAAMLKSMVVANKDRTTVFVLID